MPDDVFGKESQDTNESMNSNELPAEEVRAKESGWVPFEDWDGDPDDWVEAGEFLRRAPLFKQLNAQRREIKKLQEAVSFQQKHFDEQLIKQRDNVIRQLKEQRAMAIRDGEVELVDKIDTEMEQIKQTVPNVQPVQTPPPEFTDWVEKNTWYNTLPKLRLEAETYGQILVEQVKAGTREQMSYGDMLKEVAKHIRKEYPEHFERRNSAPRVENGTETPRRTSRTERGRSFDDIPEEHKGIAKTICRSTGMTRDEYAKRYFEERA